MLEDPHFVDVQVHVARPGELVRVIHARDAVEPRWKVDGPGGVFPGFVSAPTTVGEGQTRRLGRVAVVEVASRCRASPSISANRSSTWPGRARSSAPLRKR